MLYLGIGAKVGQFKRNHSWRFRWIYQRASFLLLVISVGINLALAVQLKNARVALAQEPFVTGVAPSIRLRGAGNASTILTFDHDSLPVLFYWFSPACGWCELNVGNLKALMQQAQGKYRIVPVSLAAPSELQDYAGRRQLSFPVYTISQAAAADYRFSGTP